MKNFKRTSGILLHPTSLPGPDGIGDLGPDAYRWVDFIAQTGCGIWQVLPLGPTGYGDSPYQCFSAFAGNPNLISSTLLLESKLLTRTDFAERPSFPAHQVDFGPVIQWKSRLLNLAYERFKTSCPADVKQQYHQFVETEQYWLDDFALFMTLKDHHNGSCWKDWHPSLRQRDPAAIKDFRATYASQIEQHVLRQFLFFSQWNNLHQYAAEKNIQIIGDIPIFIAYDSADAWSHRELFHLDSEGQPTAVAGVPPDYFSPTGQLWGNPLYHWDVHRADNYQWWVKRFQSALTMYDIIRLDHFRGFAGYWEVPAGMPTAEQGQWVKGPGSHFFQAIEQALGKLPIIAEDLGEITPDVFELRDQFNLPGMKIAQFAFNSTPEAPFLPHNYPINCVAYTGTHDNDTTRGWFDNAPAQEHDFCARYLGRSVDSASIADALTHLVWSSVAFMTLAPLQDFLNLNNDARMNFPGRFGGNWCWRVQANALTQDLAKYIYELNYLYSRLNVLD